MCQKLLSTSGVPHASLLSQMAATPRYRYNGLPKDTPNIVIFADRRNATEAYEAVAAHCPQAVIAGIYIHKGETSSIITNVHGKNRSIPVLAPDSLKDFPYCLAVLFWSGSIVPDLLYHIETAIQNTLSIAIFPRISMGTGRKMDAALYSRFGRELEDIYKNLADDESRLSFASVIKGLLTGDIEWLRPPVSPEYQHPDVLPSRGDIVLDAGLFDSTVLRSFALAVGSQGHCYGFEPEPENMTFVRQTIQQFGDPGNITLVDKGLFSHRCHMHISAQGSSGALQSSACVDSSPCEVIDVDSFVEEYSLPRIDLIKMDIEGAEMDALRGAVKSIQRWKPKLHICAYHHIQDVIDIPMFIREIVPDYRFYFTAHAPYLNEYVYYGVCR